MKKYLSQIVAFCLGAVLFGGGVAIATDLVVLPSTATVKVDGAVVPVDAYNINGANYFKLRDFASAVDVGVWWDGPNNTVNVDTSLSYDANYTGPAIAEPDPPESRIIYITKTGLKYHYSSTCNGGTYTESTLEQALSKGLTPCEKCVIEG